jgi:hypothetical protein
MAISNSVLAVVSAAALCAGTFSMKAISGTILNFSGTDPALIGDMYPVESLGVIGTLDVDLDTPASFTGTTFNTYADAVIAMDIEVFDINDNSLGTIQATGGDVRIDDSGQVGLLQILNFESYTGLPTGTFQQRRSPASGLLPRAEPMVGVQVFRSMSLGLSAEMTSPRRDQ